MMMQDYACSYQPESMTSSPRAVAANETAVAHRSIRDSFFEQAAHQNADGVVSLQQGDCGRAFHSFVASLTTLSHFRDYHLTHLPPDPPLTCSAPSPPPAAPASKSKNCKAIAVPYLEDSGFYIYNHAVIFSRRPRLGTDDVETGDSRSVLDDTHSSWQLDTAAYCEAVAQFNLGLAYHQRGNHCGEDRTLMGALELYEQALSTLQTIGPRNRCQETKILQLAIMNNRIHILNELARFQQAQNQVNDLLLQSVDALASVNPDSTGLSFLARTDIDNFLLNALVIRRFTTSPCA